jgi:hypothetical protein
MDQLIPSLAQLLLPLRDCFRAEVFQTFQTVCAAWLLCPGPRTLTEVWQATGLAATRHIDLAYSLFRSARWDWDELGALLALLLLSRLAPAGLVWLVVDDTLCHKRGAKVAFGGIFLDPVLSSKRCKVLRFATNWVVLGLAFRLPFRPDRCYCLPVLWRVFRKKGLPGHRKRTQLAAELARMAAGLTPDRPVWLVADQAYVNAAVLRDRPANLQVVGPLPKDAALYRPAPPPAAGQRGRRRKKGERLPNPAQMLQDTGRFPAAEEAFDFPGGKRTLRVQVVREVLWYTACKQERLAVVLVRDPAGQWRDEALLCTDPGASAAQVIEGYCRRWSIELAFHDSKQYLGLHDPQVRCERSVERAHPMAWFCLSLTVLWYAAAGQEAEGVKRQRPWYRPKASPTFTAMLGALRLQLWRQKVFHGEEGQPPSPETLEMLLHWLAAVR